MEEDPTESTLEIRDARRWLVLAAAALGAFSATVTGTSVNVALPSLVEIFDTTFPVVQWVVLAYLLSMSALLPIVGRLADMWGKKAIFIAGFVVFVLGSLLSGLAPTIGWLIAMRAFQGIGAAVLTSIGLAIVTDVFPAEERGRAIGITGAVLSTGVVFGPTLGGFLVDSLGWYWVFLIGVPVGLVGILLTLRFVPAYRRGPRQRFDIPGAALLLVTLLSLSLGLTLGQSLGFTSTIVLSLLALAAIGTVAFVVVERRIDQPLLDLELFRNPTFTLGLVVGFITFVSIAGTIFLMPFYLENVLGYPPFQVGILMSVSPILLVIVAPLAGWFGDRFGERPVTVAGISVLLLGYLALGSLTETSSATGYVLRFVLVGLGMAIFQTPNNSAIMGSAPRGRSGVAGGLLALTRALGQTAGIAVLGSLWAGRVAARAQAGTANDFAATDAPAHLQVAGLHDMLTVIQIGIAFGLVLCVWDLIRKREEAVPVHSGEAPQ